MWDLNGSRWHCGCHIWRDKRYLSVFGFISLRHGGGRQERWLGEGVFEVEGTGHTRARCSRSLCL